MSIDIALWQGKCHISDNYYDVSLAWFICVALQQIRTSKFILQREISILVNSSTIKNNNATIYCSLLLFMKCNALITKVATNLNKLVFKSCPQGTYMYISLECHILFATSASQVNLFDKYFLPPLYDFFLGIVISKLILFQHFHLHSHRLISWSSDFNYLL